MRARSSRGTAVIIAVCAAAAGAGLACILLPSPVPAALSGAGELGDVTVTNRDFLDERTVSVAVEPGSVRTLVATAPGTVTGTTCTPGRTIDSGSVVFSVDGRPMLALATSVPLWRDLGPGDRGDDVRSLQQELDRLGYAVAADGELGLGSVDAVASMRGQDDDVESSIRRSDIMWVPAPSNTVVACPAPLGSSLDAHAPLVSLAPTTGRAVVQDLPGDLLPGPRSLVVGAVTVAVGADGVVTDPATVTALAAAAPHDAAEEEDGPVSVTGALVLQTPVIVGVVPPSALYDLTDSTACVLAGHTATRVRTVSSQLGETFVLPEGREALPASVAVSPGRRPPCA